MKHYVKYTLLFLATTAGLNISAQQLIAVDDYPAPFPEETSKVIDVVKNDSWTSGCPKNSMSVEEFKDAKPKHGTVRIVNTNRLEYTPDVDFFGKDSFQYEIRDCDILNAVSDTAWVFLTILPENDPPIAENDTIACFDEDLESITIDVQINDSDPDGTEELYTRPVSFREPKFLPKLALNAFVIDANQIIYRPKPNAFGNDTFLYVLCDDAVGATESLCDSAWVYICINPVNDPPVAVNDSANIKEDSVAFINVLLNDYDVDDSLLTISICSVPLFGDLKLIGDSTFRYTPKEHANGLDSFCYYTCDTSGACDTAWVYIEVAPVMDPPEANDDVVVVDEDNDVQINVQFNDLEPDGEPLVTTLCGGPYHGSVTIVGDTSLYYEPEPDYNGNDTICYIICDPTGLCDTANVYITVIPVGDPPEANDDYEVTIEATPIAIEVLANDMDPEGEVLSVQIITPARNGSAVLLPNGEEVQYSPKVGFLGVDSFQYVICDTDDLCDTAWVYITIAKALDAVDDFATVDMNDSVSIDVLNNDINQTEDTVVLKLADEFQAQYGSTELVGKEVLYTPNAGFHGADSFVYVICSPSGTVVDSAWVYIDVDAPYSPFDLAAFDDAYTLHTDSLGEFEILINDILPDEMVIGSVRIIKSASNGTAAIVNDELIYKADAGFTGLDTVCYEICDIGNPPYCDTAEVVIDVFKPNIGPTANDDFYNTNKNDPITQDARTNDSDPDNANDELTVTIIEGPEDGEMIVNADGTVTYIPATDSTGVYFVTYQLCDPAGLCDTAIITIIVSDSTDVPTVEFEDLVNIPCCVSPNGDGINDYWVVEGITEYPENHLFIFNRWGDIIVESNDISDENAWDGEMDENWRKTGSGTVPDGVYYYQLTIIYNGKEYTQADYILVKR